MDGVALRAARLRLGLSQQALGVRLGVARNTIARWERGERRIEHPALLCLALARLATEPAGEDTDAPAEAEASA